jgi:deazaflavin-dependent oxidoreductase (nitroreductase family)
MDQRSQGGRAPLTRSRGLAFMRRVFGPLWLRGGFTVILIVPGRRTGRPMHVTLYPIELDGTSYLLSQYGVSDWVRNLRAAGRGELRRKGRTQAFKAVEVGDAERDRVYVAFKAMVPKPARRDSDQLPAAADHPVFRLEPIT